MAVLYYLTISFGVVWCVLITPVIFLINQGKKLHLILSCFSSHININKKRKKETNNNCITDENNYHKS